MQPVDSFNNLYILAIDFHKQVLIELCVCINNLCQCL